MNRKKKIIPALRAEQIMAGGFLLIILAGSLLLMIPGATVPGEHTAYIDALFTAATSVCVTGLVTVTTATHWTLFGKVVILVLIQLGGLGVIAVCTSTLMLLKKRLTLSTRKLIADTYNMENLKDMSLLIKRIVLGTLVVEALGTIPYAVVFIPAYGSAGGLWRALFNSISCFCNAGIDILGADSLAPYVTNPLININTMLLIILGGIGFTVWYDVGHGLKVAYQKKRGPREVWRRLELHSRLAITTSLILVLGGALLIMLFDWNHADSLGSLSGGNKVMAAFFQSITLRTAGFQTIPQENFTDATGCISLVLMFIGGSPLGTAGGMKTTSFAIIFLTVTAYIRGRDQAEVFGRRLRPSDVRTAIAVISFGFMVLFAATTLISRTDAIGFQDALYEVTSAVATVGLSRGLTSSLSVLGKVIIIVVMFFGRMGPITMAMAIARRTGGKSGRAKLPEKRILIG